jgi:hypothetical protein
MIDVRWLMLSLGQPSVRPKMKSFLSSIDVKPVDILEVSSI